MKTFEQLFSTSKIVDLSHTISEEMPHWPGDPATRIRPKANVAPEGYNLNELSIGEHSGAHIGAPFHFGEQESVDEIPPEKLIVRGVNIDISASACEHPDYLLSLNDVIEWEKKQGDIPTGGIVLVQTRWSERWSDAELYFGRDEGGMHFPGVSMEAAAYLLEHRQIVGLGIDSAGVDGGQSDDFAVNTLLARKGVFHLENLANLEALGDEDFYLFIGALKIKHGSGSPCRVLAFFF